MDTVREVSAGQGLWSVASQAGDGKHMVSVGDGTNPTCSCPDYRKRERPCKHIYAVAAVFEQMRSQQAALQQEASIVPPIEVPTPKALPPRYTQNWSAYNKAQANEKRQVADLLHALCRGVQEPPPKKGPRPIPRRDLIFCAAMQVYLGRSARRASSYLKDLADIGYLDRAPHYNTVLRGLADPALTPILTVLIEESAAPLAAVERTFAADSTGFSGCTYRRWYDERYGKLKSSNEWVKLHAMCGTTTTIVTAAVVSEAYAHDAQHLTPLLKATARNFDIEEVCADKGYLARYNVEAIDALGARAYIPFKENVQEHGPEIWRRLYHFYHYNREAFDARYHLRSNVESAFSAIKRLLGASVRGKGLDAMRNEVLCKVLVYNLICLVHSIYEFDLTPTFWTQPAAAEPPIGLDVAMEGFAA